MRRFWWLPLLPVLLGASILSVMSLAWGGPWWVGLLLVCAVPSGMVSGYWLALRHAGGEQAGRQASAPEA